MGVSTDEETEYGTLCLHNFVWFISELGKVFVKKG